MSKLGYKQTEEHKKKISQNHSHYWLGKKKPIFSKETRNKMRKAKLGGKLTKETKQKIALSIKGMFAGEKNWNWKGGITPIRKKLYFSNEYKLWRKSVFERDNYTCIWCGQVGGKLNADHIKPWALFPELRFAIDNGRTLCESCHRTTDTYGVHKK